MSNVFLKAVYVYKWYEVSDGIHRPDHYSLHASKTLALAFKDDAQGGLQSPNFYYYAGSLQMLELASRDLYMCVINQGNVISELNPASFVSHYQE